MGILDFFFGSSQVQEPDGKTTWLGEPVKGANSRGGSNGNEWWSDVEQQNRQDEGGFFDGII